MADITITIPDAQVQRVREAFEYRFGGATEGAGDPVVIDAAYFKQWLAEQIKQFVVAAERDKARQQARENISPPDVT